MSAVDAALAALKSFADTKADEQFAAVGLIDGALSLQTVRAMETSRQKNRKWDPTSWPYQRAIDVWLSPSLPQFEVTAIELLRRVAETPERWLPAVAPYFTVVLEHRGLRAISLEKITKQFSPDADAGRRYVDAIVRGDAAAALEAVRAISNPNFEVTWQDLWEQPLLQVGIAHDEIVDLLISRGATTTDAPAWLLAHRCSNDAAALPGRMEHLIDAGGELDISAEALVAAASEDSRLHVTKLLLEYGANPKTPSPSGDTAIERAKGNGCHRTLELLLKSSR